MRLLRGRTLSGRVALVALGAIACWLVALLIGLNLLVRDKAESDLVASMRVRAQAAVANVIVEDGRVTGMHDSPDDSALDESLWVVADGRVLISPAGSAALTDTVLAAATAPAGPVAAGRRGVRIYTQPVLAPGGGRVGAAVVAADATGAARAERWTLVGSIAVGVMLLAGLYPVLRLTATRALRPVDEMTRLAARWSISDPGRRFGATQRFAELATLAHTLDALLDRLAGILRHEREVSAELSHELRTPLTRILAETELLQHDSQHTDEAGAVAGIRASALGMERIIDTLLASSRAEHAADLGRCRVEAMIHSVIDAPNVTVEVDPPDLYVAVDQQLGERILAPVLANAARFARTTIDVRAAGNAGRVFIDIGNDGPPIADADSEAIFLPGQRGPRPDDHPGAGLGLPLARRLARAAEGDVRLLAGDPVRFRVELPA